MNRYNHLIHTTWDQTFLSNPAFFTWFEDQLKQVPLGPTELLENYVRNRIAAQTAVRTSLSGMDTGSSSSSSSSSLGGVGSGGGGGFSSTANYGQSNLVKQQCQPIQQQQQSNQQQQQQQRTQSNTDISDIFDMNSYSNDTTNFENNSFSTTSTSNSNSNSSNSNNNLNQNNYMNPSTAYSTYNFPPQPNNSSTSTNYFPSTSSTSSSTSIDPSLVLQPPPTTYPPSNYSHSQSHSASQPHKPVSPSPSPAPSLAPPPPPSTSLPSTINGNNGVSSAAMTPLQAQAELLHNERNAKLARARSGIIEEPIIVVPIKSKKSTSPPSTKSKIISKPIASGSKSTSVSTSTSKSTTTTSSSTTSSTGTRRDSLPPKSEKPTELELTELWNRVAVTAKELLTLSRLQKAPMASSEKLSEIISTFSLSPTSSSSSSSSSNTFKEKEKEEISAFGDSSTIPPESRIELLNLLNNNSKEGSEFYKVLVKDEKMMLGIKIWLSGATLAFTKISKGGEVSKNFKRLEGMLVGILLLFDKLPFTVELLKKYNIGSRIAKLSNHSDNQVKTLSARLVSRWSAFLAPNEAVGSNDKSKRKSTDDRADPKKKLKANESASTTASTSKATATVVAKPAPISFAKPALPSFKKVPPPPPVVLSPFELAKAKINAAKTASTSKPIASSSSKPDVSTGALGQGVRNNSNSGMTSSMARSNRNGSQKVVKVVKFKEASELTTIRWIPNIDQMKAEADGTAEGPDSFVARDDEMDTSGDGGEVESQSWTEKYEAMSEQEGATLIEHYDTDMDEEVKWYQPIEVIVPNTVDFSTYNTPAQSLEVGIQALRESTAIVADYAFDLDSPSEPPSEPESTDPTVMIVLPSELMNDQEVMRAIALAQLAKSEAGERRGSGNLADTGELMSLLNDLVPTQSFTPNSSSTSNNYDLPPHLRNQNQNNINDILDSNKLAELRSYDPAVVANLVQTTPHLQSLAGKLSPYGMGSQGSAPPPPTNQYGYPAVYERPIPSSLTSQQSTSSNLNSWETGSNNSSQYNYGPTYAPATEVITPKRGSRGRVTKGRRSSKRGGGQDGPQVCKFWGTPKGCDWAEKCFNLHE